MFQFIDKKKQGTTTKRKNKQDVGDDEATLAVQTGAECFVVRLLSY